MPKLCIVKFQPGQVCASRSSSLPFPAHETDRNEESPRRTLTTQVTLVTRAVGHVHAPRTHEIHGNSGDARPPPLDSSSCGTPQCHMQKRGVVWLAYSHYQNLLYFI